MTNPTFEPIDLLGVLRSHGVAFVTIGGFAAELQGVSWSTLDVDPDANTTSLPRR